MAGRSLVVLLDALAARFGGTAYAVLQVARALEERSDVARVVVVAQEDSIVGRDVRATDTIVPVLLPIPSARAEIVWRFVWEARHLPRLVDTHDGDVLVSFSGMVPRRPGCPVVAILANPVPFVDRSSAGGWLRRAAISRTLRFTISAYVPTEGMRSLIGAPNLKVVPLGVDHARFNPAPRPGTELLYVADFYAHKRHDLLLAAWRLMPEPRPPLRLIGNPAVDERTFAAVRAAADDPRISVDGRVGFSDLLDAYAKARAVALPSERESFAMPLAEALACGVPAVIRDDPVLRETAGPGALVVETATAPAWAAALHRVVTDDALHAELREAGVVHAQRYSWDALAAEITTDAVVRR